MTGKLLVCAAVLFLCSFLSCRKTTDSKQEASITQAPVGFPAIPFPDDNPYTEAKWILGKKLFYDNALSINNTINCGSCHKATLAFSDDVSMSMGALNIPGTRNSPSLANVAYHPYYTREGGVPTLEMQILVPIQEHNEFANNIVDIAERLKEIPEYVTMSAEVFGRVPDAYVITRALATFERTLVSGNSAYDKAEYAGDASAMSASERSGRALFFSSRTNCQACHSGFNFTNYSFENNGLYEEYADNGRERLTKDSNDRALFKVPSLRNVALTAPYMHDGSMNTLEEVINHYNSGGYPHPHKSTLIAPMNLTEKEKSDLVAFLKSLSDYKFITNKKFANEDQ